MEIKSTEIVLIPIDQIVLNEKNRNEHPQEQIDHLAEQFNYQGFRIPVVISTRSGKLVAGHGRYWAAKKLGMKELPATFQDFTDEDQEYAFGIAENATQHWSILDFSKINTDLADLSPDFNIDMLGIKDFEIDIADKSADKDEDAVPENVPTKTRMGDLYKLGDHRLLCGDSTNIQHVERLMGGEKADMVFTDPPYGMSVVKSGMVGADFGVAKKGSYKEVIGDDSTDTAKAFYGSCVAVGLEKFIIWGGNYFTDFLEPSKSWVIWNKRADTGIKNTFADGEMAWSNLGHPVRIHNQLWNGMIRSGEKDKRVHPTQKPIALVEYGLDLMSDCGSVYDGFGGSGSTLIACEKTRRKCFMMELDPHYCDVIVERFQKFSDKKAVRINEDGTETPWDEITALA